MANTYTTVDELKKHLNIETEFTDDDAYLLELISVAEMAVYNYCNGGVAEASSIVIDDVAYTALPKDIKHAIILLCSHLYLNRSSVSFAQGFEVPLAFKFLLNPYRNMAIQ
jgi:hypothetical protein